MKLKRKSQECSGCGEHFLTFKNYDYCVDCAINGNRYISPSNCSECDGSGRIKFRNQPPRPCKLCALTKKNMTKKTPKKPTKLSAEDQFWEEVRQQSKNLIANLVRKALPIDTTPQNFDLERDVDYRVLLGDDLPNYYADDEDYQTKITTGNWDYQDVEYAAQEASLWYLRLVIKSFLTNCSNYAGYDPSLFENLTTNKY